MRFLFKVTTETVGSQHLQRTEKDKVAKLAIKIGFVNRLVFAKSFHIFLQQFFTEAIRIFRFRLPQERGYVIIERAFASALKVDKPRFPVFYHHITTLKITIHESSGRTAEQDIAHFLEIIFQFVFLKLHTGSFQEAIFEVIQIPQNGALVELRLRITTGKIKSIRPGKLNSRKQTDRFAKQLFFLFGKNTGSTSFLYGMEQQSIAQIFLQIIGFIFRGNAHFGNRQSTFAEVSCHIKKSFILINRSPVDSNQCFYTRQPKITAVGTGRR